VSINNDDLRTPSIPIPKPISTHMSAPLESPRLPVIVRDPRFVAGRATVGQRTAVDVFATLLQDAVRTYGESATQGIETTPAYYEYGNALLRYALRQQAEAAAATETPTNETGAAAASLEQSAVDLRAAAAAAAERRAQRMPEESTHRRSDPPRVASGSDAIPKETAEDASPDEDIALALEMMETAWAILDAHRPSSTDAETQDSHPYSHWIMEQLPRVLTGIGDTLSALHRHADAVDAYLRALEHRQSMLDQCLAGLPPATDLPSTNADDIEKQLQVLKYRRQVVEVTILLVEELLSCGNDQDVVTTESQVVLVTQGNVVDYARGYYDRARDELQETVLLLGQVAAVSAADARLREEKENICFVATMVMGAGTTLAELDEPVAAAREEPSPKKRKK
jgi:tetratricopeptide (TPR) repeat protein